MSKFRRRGFVLLIFLTLFSIATPRGVAQSPPINVADHGVLPGKDATFPLGRLIESVKDQSGVTLVFPKGQYDFYPENARQQHRAVANHDNSLKHMAFPLFGCRKITIDGGGSTFMFHGRISPFVLDGVDGATLKNFSIDWKRPFQSELKVVEHLDDGSFVVDIDREEFPFSVVGGQLLFEHYDWQDPIGMNIVLDPATRAPLFETKKFRINANRPIQAKALEGNRVKLKASGKKRPPVGTVIVSYGSNPTSRLCPAIHVANSSDIEVENVNVYAGGGMALIAERTENVTLKHLVVSSTEKRMAGPRADATHFVGCKGMIHVEDCLFEHMLDDGINVHGAYVKVAENLDAGQFICEISHPQQWGMVFAQPGDQVAVLSRETLLPLFQSTVKQVEVLNEHRMLLTLADVPEEIPPGLLSMENLSWYPDLVFKKNIVRENRARSVLVTTKGKVLIEDNYFSSQMHGILIEGDNNKWYESGAVQDITIKNNVFENTGFGGNAGYPLLASPLLTGDQRLGAGHYHRNIKFVDNSVKSFNGHLAQARSVSGLTISGNTLELSSDYPKDVELPSIDLEYCDSTIIENNQAWEFKLPVSISVSADSTEITIGSNDGFEKR